MDIAKREWKFIIHSISFQFQFIILQFLLFSYLDYSQLQIVDYKFFSILRY